MIARVAHRVDPTRVELETAWLGGGAVNRRYARFAFEDLAMNESKGEAGGN